MLQRSLLGFALVSLLSSCNNSSNGAASVSVAPSPVPAPAAERPADPSVMQIDNLDPDQKITEDVPAQFRIHASSAVAAVAVQANGQSLGNAVPGKLPQQFKFITVFENPGEHDLTFTALAKGSVPLTSATYRVRVVPKETPAPSRLFNAYVLKAVDYLNKNYGLLGYNINAQLTHELSYYKYGVMKPTKGGLTMCVAGVLEVILTAFDLYSKETGNFAIYDFLPFRSWSSLTPTSIKAHIWVNPKLNSNGTGDAVAKFGIGERVKFRDLEPGGFININRTNGSGHAVTFLSFIDKKGNDVARYDESVVGFRYFGAQGRAQKGEGGFGFRHAFFSKYGCPEVPYQRDCNVILSDNPKLLNVGQIFDPRDWKSARRSFEEVVAPLPGDDDNGDPVASPQDFDGLTTDD